MVQRFSNILDKRSSRGASLLCFLAIQLMLRSATSIWIDKEECSAHSGKDNKCSKNYKPACATDGFTYRNRCELEKVHKKVFKKLGECPPKKNCPIPKIYAPVCGVNGKTYSNKYAAACAKMTIDYTGQCKLNCKLVNCSNDYKPACATDGFTYKNRCQLECVHNKKFDYVGECPAEDGCVCTKEYKPVCGVNGQTYGNACMAKCARMTVEHTGECKLNCELVKCSNDYEPACATDGFTYKNRCQLECVHNKKFDYVGECPENQAACGCTREYKPVCGVNGKTYGNACMAKCASMTVEHTGECKGSKGCMCPLAPYGTFPPVCGKDGQNYENACQAGCAGVKVAHEGLCRLNCKVIRCNSTLYDPVCGKDGITYKNQCIADCVKDKPLRQFGPCKPKTDCNCILVFDPVCGVDGKTYGNSCQLGCANMDFEHDGEC